jgi:hypothetical protein
MRLKKTNALRAMLVVGTVMGTTAFAGYRYGSQVQVDTVARKAGGTMATARASADTKQYLGCGFRATPTSLEVYCQAQDANGVQAQCISASQTFVQALGALQSDMSLYFEWDANGRCTFIGADNYSSNPPKAP